MKLKFYLRGMGVGIILTALLLHFTLPEANASMTDEEIMQRAEQLGMIQNTILSDVTTMGNNRDDAVLSENQPDADVSDNEVAADSGEESVFATAASTPTPSVSPSSIPTPSATPASTSTPSATPTSTPTAASTPTPSASATATPTPTPTPVADDTTEYVIITVVGGDSSYTVARKVAEAGLVSSAAEYDEFLCTNGFDKTLCVGNHQIPVDATEEEIALILTTRQ